MNLKKLSLFCLYLSANSIFAQVGINNKNPQASLQVDKSARTDTPSGVIVPNLTAEEVKAMTNSFTDNGKEQNSMLIYVTDGFTKPEDNTAFRFMNAPGYYYFNYNSDPQKRFWVKLQNTYNGRDYIFPDTGTGSPISATTTPEQARRYNDLSNKSLENIRNLYTIAPYPEQTFTITMPKLSGGEGQEISFYVYGSPKTNSSIVFKSTSDENKIYSFSNDLGGYTFPDGMSYNVSGNTTTLTINIDSDARKKRYYRRKITFINGGNTGWLLDTNMNW